MYPYQFELWEAINDYAESCGGDTSDKTARRPSRIKAVVAVEEIIEKLRFASEPCVQGGRAEATVAECASGKYCDKCSAEACWYRAPAA